jgi:hypothetical protein
MHFGTLQAATLIFAVFITAVKPLEKGREPSQMGEGIEI